MIRASPVPLLWQVVLDKHTRSSANCASAVPVTIHHLPSLTLAVLVIIFITRRSFAASFSIYLDHDYTNMCLPTLGIRFTRSRYLGHALARAPLAYLPSLHLSVSSRLSAPSQCVLATPLRSVVWRYDMSLRRSQSPPLTRFGLRLFTRHHSPVGFYQVAGDFVPCL
jgi:hypothetical protein